MEEIKDVIVVLMKQLNWKEIVYEKEIKMGITIVRHEGPKTKMEIEMVWGGRGRGRGR